VLCGLAEPGLWLPYRNLDGSAIRDGDQDYGRLRLDKPQKKRKYHQAAGTGVHVYLPPGLADATVAGGDLFIIEGEFKSLALAEAGFAAVGISGFYGFSVNGGNELAPELATVLAIRKPDRILFCGDADTAFNYQFSNAVVRLSNLVKPLPVWLPRIPLNGPGKGADDCRAKLNGTFEDWWRERIVSAVAVKAETTAGRLTIGLFEAEEAAITNLGDTARMDAEERVVKLAASLNQQPLLQERVLTFATKKLGMGRRGLCKAAEAVEKQIRGRRHREGAEGKGREIEHDQPAAVWARQVWEATASMVYRYAGQVCRFHEGQLHPQSPAEMVSFLDDPDRCQFMTHDRKGEAIASSFTEADARVFLGAWMDALDLARTVEVFSTVPVLAWNGQQSVLVNGYDRSLRILAGGQPVTLPSTTEAVTVLVELLRDYDFVTSGDLGRAIALLLSPALAQGGFLGKGRVPLFLVEKNQASAGGSLLLRLACQIYGLKPQPISRLDNRDRAVEDLSRLLLSGAGFIYFDNARGRGLQNLPELESLLTEPIFNCRAPWRRALARTIAKRTIQRMSHKRPSSSWPLTPDGTVT
jgi:hypothetical protein